MNNSDLPHVKNARSAGLRRDKGARNFFQRKSRVTH
jgi:hypothetical protein